MIQRAYRRFIEKKYHEALRIQQNNVNRRHDIENEALTSDDYKHRFIHAVKLIQRYWLKKQKAKKEGRKLIYDDNHILVQ